MLWLWALILLGTSVALLAFMFYIIPLPGLVPQIYEDRLVAWGIAISALIFGVIGFACLSVVDRPARRSELVLPMFLQAIAELSALFAFFMVGLGR